MLRISDKDYDQVYNDNLTIEFDQDDRENACIYFNGTFNEATHVGEQLLWLASVFRRSDTEHLTLSTSYCTWRLDGQTNYVEIGLHGLCKTADYLLEDSEEPWCDRSWISYSTADCK